MTNNFDFAIGEVFNQITLNQPLSNSVIRKKNDFSKAKNR